MAEQTKNQLRLDNEQSFPNNNTGFITAEGLRTFNENMIDSLATQAEVDGLQSQITEIEGNRDPVYISKFINVMPAYDSLKFREYSDEIEPGIDLEVEVEGPSGPFLSVFSIGPNFFWPNARV